MRLYQPTYKDRRGRTRKTSKFYCEFKDTHGAVRRLPGFTDRAASDELGRKLERLVALRVAGEVLDVTLVRWLEELPERLRKSLARIGLLDERRLAASRPLSELVAEFKESLLARGTTTKHAELTTRRLTAVHDDCRWTFWSDLDALGLERHLRRRREPSVGEDGETRPGLSAKASNHVLAAFKQFARWAVEHGLAHTDPFVTLRPLNARVDVRRERRALSWDVELPKLVRTAAAGPEHRGVSGPVRALVYRLAAETGLRVAEIQGLTVGDLRLDGERPTVTVRAAVAKNRRETTLPLRPETARELAPLLRSKLPTAPALPLPRSFKDKATRWLRFDLKAARIPYEDDSGRVADFHALRAAFVSALMRSGASPKVVQSLARHSSAELTLGLYSKLGRDDERQALERLPALPNPWTEDGRQEARRTGTDGAPARGSEPVLASCLASKAGQHETDADSHGPWSGADGAEEALVGAADGGGGGSRTRVPE